MLRRGDPCVSKPRDFRALRAVLRALLQSPKSHLNFKGLGPHSQRRCRACEVAARAPHVAGAETIVSGMAGRYATALFELALERGSVDGVKGDLERFDALVGASADLARLVRS